MITKRIFSGALAAVALAAVTTGANANGLNSDGGFAFMSDSGKQTEQTSADLKQRVDGGYYDSFKATVNCEAGSQGCGAVAGGVGYSSTQIGSYLSTNNSGGITTINSNQTNSGTQVGSGGGGVTVNSGTGVPVGGKQ